jgi:hypothetical protein
MHPLCHRNRIAADASLTLSRVITRGRGLSPQCFEKEMAQNGDLVISDNFRKYGNVVDTGDRDE